MNVHLSYLFLDWDQQIYSDQCYEFHKFLLLFGRLSSLIVYLVYRYSKKLDDLPSNSGKIDNEKHKGSAQTYLFIICVR